VEKFQISFRARGPGLELSKGFESTAKDDGVFLSLTRGRRDYDSARRFHCNDAITGTEKTGEEKSDFDFGEFTKVRGSHHDDLTNWFRLSLYLRRAEGYRVLILKRLRPDPSSRIG